MRCHLCNNNQVPASRIRLHRGLAGSGLRPSAWREGVSTPSPPPLGSGQLSFTTSLLMSRRPQ